MIKSESATPKPEGSIMGSDVRGYFQDKAKKQPKRARTRAIILDGIVETIARYGLEGTTIREIVESAGVSHGTFYNHFENRDEAMRKVVSAARFSIDNARTMRDTKGMLTWLDANERVKPGPKGCIGY